MDFDLASAISEYGFPIIAALGMGYFIFFIWKWVTEVIDPVLGETMFTLIKLVDRVRMLDNDLIRLNSKLSMVLEYRSKLNPRRQDELHRLVAEYQSGSKAFNSTGEDNENLSGDNSAVDSDKRNGK
jgi:hypothetical protein|tara:strand:+ start:1419 stop:1799 length:381 start_codon:yes stop_codon:yes gene_type:complete